MQINLYMLLKVETSMYICYIHNIAYIHLHIMRLLSMRDESTNLIHPNNLKR